MQVYKFGGASVKDAESVRNVCAVIKITQLTKGVVVVSAMGKMTNAFEAVVAAYTQQTLNWKEELQKIADFHLSLIQELFPNKQHAIYSQLKTILDEVKFFIDHNKSPNYDYIYDQIVPVGELLSTQILYTYLLEEGFDVAWLDIRKCLKTDSSYREAKVDWEGSRRRMQVQVNPSKITVTQGFIGSDENGFSTTLGREGSDYTAGIIAFCLNAEAVTIWKDVPGVLNADPRYFEHTQLLHKVSYQEAIELAFYGASVIHPKTLQPLRKKEIPLYVKPFTQPETTGTCVTNGISIEPLVPCFILKKDLRLLRLSSLDFSFIVEEKIGSLFKILSTYKIKVELMQNSAITFSLCITDKFSNFDQLAQTLRGDFKLDIIENVNLYTIRHFNTESIDAIENSHEVLLKQITAETVQFVTK